MPPSERSRQPGVRLSKVLAIEAFRDARLVAGERGVDGDVSWAHVVDVPDPLPWTSPGQLLLTTGVSWPASVEEQVALIGEFANRRLAGVALAVPKFLDRFPNPVMERADETALPLLEIPWEIPFAAITQAVNTLILAESYTVIEQASLIHRALTQAAVTAGTLQNLADTLGGLIQRDITIEDPEGRVLANWREPSAEDPVREETLATGATPTAVLRHLERTGELGRILSARAPVRIDGSKELGLAGRVVCPIWLRGELVGLVWIIEGQSELSELHIRAAEHAATVAALHIAGQRQLAAVETRLGTTFLDALLEGRFDASPHSLERANMLGFDPAGTYRVAILSLDPSAQLTREGVVRRDRLGEALRHRLTAVGEIGLISSRPNQLIFLMRDGRDPGAIWRTQKADGGGLALGRAYPGADGVRRSFQEAVSILGHIQPGQMRRYEEMLVLRVLTGDADARSAFREQMFGRLRSQRGGDTLVKTLIALAEKGFERRGAAASLHIHPNTLRYRLDRVTDILGLDLGDSEVRFQLQLAAHLETMHKESAQF